MVEAGMNALVFDGASASIKSVPRPSSTTEALIRVSLVGICATDREIIKCYGEFCGILGHEFVGVIADRTAP